MGLLSIIKGRAAREPRIPIDFDLDDSPPTLLRSSSLMSRPPPLDSKTERELREACAIVLADLKPSGHDLEDTRMKSDVLVGHDDALNDPRAQMRFQPKTQPAQVDRTAPWTLHRDPKLSQPNHPKLDPPFAGTKQARAAMGLDMAGSNALNSRKPVPGTTSSYLAPEAPLAPAQSTASSAYPVASPQIPQAVPRDNSISTAASSSYPLSSEHSKTASTTLSSAPFTPSEASNRFSDNIYSQHASAKDSHWMKETAERQRQVYVTESAGPLHSTTRPPANSVKSPTIEVPERNASTGSRSRSLHSHPITEGVVNPPPVPRSPSRQSATSQKISMPHSPAASSHYGSQSVRPGSVGSKRSSRPASSRLSIDGIRETDRSPAASPSREDVPPVPRLDASRVSTLQSARPLSQASVAASSRGDQQWTRTESMTNGKLGASQLSNQQQTNEWPMTDTIARKPIQTTSQLHPKSEQSNGVVVKDFYQPSVAAAADGFRPLNREPRPDDFEHLMSTMNHRTSAMFDAPMDSPTVPPGTIRGLRMADPSASEQQASAAPQPAPAPVMHAIGSPSAKAAANGVNGASRAEHHSPSLSVTRNEGARSPSVPPSRGSDSRSLPLSLGAKTRKEKRGVRGLLWKLGGGDAAPERKRVYVAPAFSGGYAGYEDYWADADDQACAAPVVGFGRGW